MELKLIYIFFRYLISVSNVQFDGHGERVIQSIIFDFQDFFVLAGFNQPHLFRQFLTQFFFVPIGVIVATALLTAVLSSSSQWLLRWPYPKQFIHCLKGVYLLNSACQGAAYK